MFRFPGFSKIGKSNGSEQKTFLALGSNGGLSGIIRLPIRPSHSSASWVLNTRGSLALNTHSMECLSQRRAALSACEMFDGEQCGYHPMGLIQEKTEILFGSASIWSSNVWQKNGLSLQSMNMVLPEGELSSWILPPVNCWL